ncbi:MAG: hypothetical protein WC307_04310 [Candidatus Nanoarchaeia archaeon]|jgi:hypothetical protein
MKIVDLLKYLYTIGAKLGEGQLDYSPLIESIYSLSKTEKEVNEKLKNGNNEKNIRLVDKDPEEDVSLTKEQVDFINDICGANLKFRGDYSIKAIPEEPILKEKNGFELSNDPKFNYNNLIELIKGMPVNEIIDNGYEIRQTNGLQLSDNPNIINIINSASDIVNDLNTELEGIKMSEEKQLSDAGWQALSRFIDMNNPDINLLKAVSEKNLTPELKILAEQNGLTLDNYVVNGVSSDFLSNVFDDVERVVYSDLMKFNHLLNITPDEYRKVMFGDNSNPEYAKLMGTIDKFNELLKTDIYVTDTLERLLLGNNAEENIKTLDTIRQRWNLLMNNINDGKDFREVVHSIIVNSVSYQGNYSEDELSKTAEVGGVVLDARLKLLKEGAAGLKDYLTNNLQGFSEAQIVELEKKLFYKHFGDIMPIYAGQIKKSLAKDATIDQKLNAINDFVKKNKQLLVYSESVNCNEEDAIEYFAKKLKIPAKDVENFINSAEQNSGMVTSLRDLLDDNNAVALKTLLSDAKTTAINVVSAYTINFDNTSVKISLEELSNYIIDNNLESFFNKGASYVEKDNGKIISFKKLKLNQTADIDNIYANLLTSNSVPGTTVTPDYDSMLNEAKKELADKIAERDELYNNLNTTEVKSLDIDDGFVNTNSTYEKVQNISVNDSSKQKLIDTYHKLNEDYVKDIKLIKKANLTAIKDDFDKWNSELDELNKNISESIAKGIIQYKK